MGKSHVRNFNFRFFKGIPHRQKDLIKKLVFLRQLSKGFLVLGFEQ